MNTIFQLIENGDICSLSLLVLIAIIAGSMMVRTDGWPRVWGKRVAAAAFVLYLFYGYQTFQPQYAEDWIGISISGALAAGLVLGCSWIALAIVEFVSRYTITSPLRKARHIAKRSGSYLQKKREEREQKNHDRREEERCLKEHQAWEAGAPERARVRLEEEKQERDLQDAEDARRCEYARTQLDLFYNGHAAELKNLLPKVKFKSLVKKYLSDAQSPEQVEKYAKLVKKTIEQYLEIDQTRLSAFESVPEILKHFTKLRTELEESDYDPETIDTLTILFNDQEDEALRRFLAS